MSWFIEALNNATISGATLTTLQSTTATFNAGQVVVNWSISGFCDQAGTGFQYRFRIGDQTGPWKQYFFSNVGRADISGTAVIPVPPGASPVSLEMQRTYGSGSFLLTNADSLLATFINIRQ